MTAKRQPRPTALALGLLVALGLAIGVTARAAAAEPTVELTPDRISIGEAAALRISADDGSQPILPSVDGLQFQRTGQSTEMTRINGAVSRHTFMLYQVVAAHPGTYTIPIGGQSLQLKVEAAGSASMGSTSTGAVQSAATQAPGSLAFLRVSLPKGKLYVGQSVLMTFKAYFRPGIEVTITNSPSLGMPAFTVSQLAEQPRQSLETVGGVPYRVATWTGLVSAAMPGSYPTSASLAIVARYREPVRQAARDPFSGMLEDDDTLPPSAMLRSFMSRSMFGGGLDDLFGQVRERELTVRAPVQWVEVLSLPEKGRPANFTGAIGRFDVQATLAPGSGAAFEPMSLKLAISGQGNFDRVTTAGLPASPTWKSYPPSAHYTPAGVGANLSGTKVFEQAVVPQVSGPLALPAIAFSFFDPERGQYFTRSTAPIAVQIADSAGGSTPAVAAAALVGADAASSAPVASLRPNQLDEGHYVATLLPPYRRAWFWLTWSILWLALAFIYARVSLRSRSPSAHARRKAVRTAVAESRVQLRQAAIHQDPVRFFAAAQQALQTQLGENWGLLPEEITAAAVESRLGESGAPIVSALRLAEQIRYAGQVPQAGSLIEYGKTLEQHLEQLEMKP